MATTTQTATGASLEETLADYAIHVSRPVSINPPSSHGQPLPAPLNWPSDHRRIPPPRPVNTNLDLSTRATRNAAEAIFVFMMLNGCYINASAAWLWRRTGERITDKFWRYRIGGEW
ncbi:hypothetical protein BDV12DRAFT_180289 [Aspergillus spectabilis]